MASDSDVPQESLSDGNHASWGQFQQDSCIDNPETSGFSSDPEDSDDEDDSQSDDDSDESESEDELDYIEESLDSEDESDFFESDTEDEGPNLFECSVVTFENNATQVTDICTASKCNKTFGTRSECIRHMKTCPATVLHSAAVRSDPVLQNTTEEACE